MVERHGEREHPRGDDVGENTWSCRPLPDSFLTRSADADWTVMPRRPAAFLISVSPAPRAPSAMTTLST